MTHSKRITIEAHSAAIKDGRTVEAFGVETLGRRFTAILPYDVDVPAKMKQTFSTADDDQSRITLHLFRSPTLGHIFSAIRLGEFRILDIAPAARGTPSIELEFIATETDLVIELSSPKDVSIEFIPELKDTNSSKYAGPNIFPRSIREVRRVQCQHCGLSARVSYNELNCSCPNCNNPLYPTEDRVQQEAPQQSNPGLSKDIRLMEALDELNKLIGLQKVKAEISTLVDFISVQNRRRSLGRPIPDMSNHLVFVGNPGTGKTTVARLIGRIYHALKICEKDTVIETDRDGLVGQYIGHTAKKTAEKIKEAIGGILFIDEAYTLTPKIPGNDFGQEAVDCLLKAMEDHRSELIVIVAGYPAEMARFISSNPGLESRFGRTIEFEDYTGAELQQIFEEFCRKHEYRVQRDASIGLREYFNDISQNIPQGFANGRGVRNMFEKILRVQSTRLSRSIETIREQDLDLITLHDVDIAIRKK